MTFYRETWLLDSASTRQALEPPPPQRRSSFAL